MQDAGNVGPEVNGVKPDECNTIHLGKMDSCIVFRQDETGKVNIECYLPSPENEDDTAPEAAVFCSIIASRTNDQKFVDEQYEWMEYKTREIEEKEVNDKG